MWKRLDIVFRLKSPLHIGYMPFEVFVFSPTRYYVPGRNFWGAITKRITEYLYEKPKAENYKEIGVKVMKNFRFSYFYVYDGKTVYLPRYTENGLRYGDDNREVSKSEFECRFIRSFVSTAIDSDGTAKDGSLHELELISNKIKDEDGNTKDVKIAGCVWIKEDTEIVLGEGIIEEFILGGESKYGFGHVVFESINEISVFEWDDPESVEIRSKPLPAHLKYEKNLKFKGDIELLTGRGYYDPNSPEKENGGCKPGAVISIPEYYFVPGTVLAEPKKFKVRWDGILEVSGNE
ncbi:MAG TPA: hypothetical protein VIL29_02620 [Pseudothermotoga sp.]|uniref:hypothetical protein n=1 Tax=Thermotoga profunda TaxID=1508420 RepID=UPI0005977ACA|nr:hypothetical protein [Thermotoga profunda]